MSLTFAKAPLIEIVVELRWVPPQVTLQGQQQPGIPLLIPTLGGSKLDEFFMRLGSRLHQQGFQAVERLLPPGFSMLHQPVYRYRKAADPSPSPVLCQAGDGLFSVHGVPPYHSWEEFCPVVENGIRALLEARDSTQKDLPFVNVSLRYIDAFSPELREGRSASEFISQVLGISVSLPEPLTQMLKNGTLPEFALQIGLLASDGARLNLNLNEASVNGVPSVLMDTTCSHSEGVVSDLGTVMKVLQSSYKTVHKLFLELTRPIQALMQPNAEELK
jgi:uncharacterized protein (TIGR04255 family)